MAPISQQIAQMVDMLPETDQTLAFELVKKLVLAWDPDYTRATPRFSPGRRQGPACGAVTQVPVPPIVVG